jgi:hypothetical protein
MFEILCRVMVLNSAGITTTGEKGELGWKIVFFVFVFTELLKGTVLTK